MAGVGIRLYDHGAAGRGSSTTVAPCTPLHMVPGPSMTGNLLLHDAMSQLAAMYGDQCRSRS